MKKWTTLALAALLALSMAACGSKDDEQKETDPTPTPTQSADAPTFDPITPDAPVDPITQDDTAPEGAEEYLLDSVFGMPELISGMSAAVQETLRGEAEMEGFALTIGTDGSAAFANAETGESMIQNADGSWTITDSDGAVANIGTSWPDNEFTRLVPQPSFAIDFTGADSESFSAMFAEPTLEEVQAYVTEIIAAGFIPKDYMENPAGDIVEVPEMGTMYDFAADNGAGYELFVTYMPGQSGIGIMKVEE